MDSLGYRVLNWKCQPTVAQEGDAGIDLRSAEDVCLPPGSNIVVSLGISFQIPLGFFGLLTHRSSLAFKHGCILSTGIIDPSFTGEVKAKIYNMEGKEVYINTGDRIAQMVVMKYAEHLGLVEFEEDFEDGKEGFGSSGTK